MQVIGNPAVWIGRGTLGKQGLCGRSLWQESVFLIGCAQGFGHDESLVSTIR